MLEKFIDLVIKNKFLVCLFALILAGWGAYVAMKTPVDAIPDMSDVQVIIYNQWAGQSPQEIEDQVTYPIAAAMLAVPKVKTVRSYSFFSYSLVYIIFQDGTDIYWARSRVLEYMNALLGRMPQGVTTTLGPDATGVGWVYEYSVEGKGYSLGELRAIQDWYIRYQLTSVPGVSEVASLGGFVMQYQVILDPNKLLAYNIPVNKVVTAVRGSNKQVGASMLEFTETEYMVRGLGYIKNMEDLKNVVISASPTGTPIRVRDIATVSRGPEMRRGVAEKDGEGEVVGGVVVMRFGENPLGVIDDVKKKLKEIEPGLPAGVKIVPAYDRSHLIHWSIETLKGTLMEEIIIVTLTCVAFLWHLPSALVAIFVLPLGIIISLIVMHYQGLNANIMSLGGIAVAIGAMVDASVVMVENVHKMVEREGWGKGRWNIIAEASKQVGPSLFFSLLIVTVSFMPVFTLQAQEGRLFKPLAFTKTYAMGASAFLAIAMIPVLMGFFIRGNITLSEGHPFRRFLTATFHLCGRLRWAFTGLAALGTVAALLLGAPTYLTIALALFLLATIKPIGRLLVRYKIGIVVFVAVALLLAIALGAPWYWGLLLIPVFIISFIYGEITPEEENPINRFLIHTYRPIMHLVLRFKWITVLLAIVAVVATYYPFKQLGSEFMPPLDEGDILYMPTTLGGVSITAAGSLLQLQDRILKTLPEAETVFGKVGRANSATDPAGLDMVETIIALKPPKEWRKGMTTAKLMEELNGKLQLPGVTNAWTMPIKTRIDMLATGIKTPIGIKVFGSDLETIEQLAIQIENAIRPVPGTVGAIAERIMSGNYVDFDIHREEAARYGLTVSDVQDVLTSAIGGMNITTTIEGRRRFPVNVRYARELRDNVEKLKRVLVPVPAPMGGGGMGPMEPEAERGGEMMKNPQPMTTMGEEQLAMGNMNTPSSGMGGGMGTMGGMNAPGSSGMSGMSSGAGGSVMSAPGLQPISMGAMQRNGMGGGMGAMSSGMSSMSGASSPMAGMAASMSSSGGSAAPIRMAGGSMGGSGMSMSSGTKGQMVAQAMPGGQTPAYSYAAQPIVQIPLGQLADIRIKKGPMVVRSENGLLMGVVYVDLMGRDLGRYMKDAKKAVAEKVKFPPGYFITWSGQYEYMMRAEARLKVIVPVTLGLIFLLLYFNFRNITEPLIVMGTLPFGLIGGVWLMYFLKFNM
ncbi:efflux RND transporter permease subunit, partial [Candidatus Poribacteria bacterium]|nr:efflux RND transporter permease subunit [Candidatus Poribacteria bacterium]